MKQLLFGAASYNTRNELEINNNKVYNNIEIPQGLALILDNDTYVVFTRDMFT